MHTTTDERPIAALATAAGEAGVAVLRMSGPGVFDVADRLVRTSGAAPSARPAHACFHAKIVNPATGDGVDDAVVLVFRAPRSYTGEDTVEIQGHGGAVPARRLLQAALQAGAILAHPGEFTRRAFLNGRLDLTQAEAVADLIQSRTDRAAAAAREQLDGALGRQFGTLYDSITSVCCDVEAMLDLDEGDLPDTFLAQREQTLAEAAGVIDALLATWNEGRLLRDGARVVIAGRPNVGKSSLLNALLGQERAIVTAHPGTTRDTIEEGYSLDGIPVRLVDTAGLREATCEVERLGIERTRAMLERADVVLYVVDGSEPFGSEDAQAVGRLPADRSVVVLNKSDLVVQTTEQQLRCRCLAPVVSVSARAVVGLDELRRVLAARLDKSCGARGSEMHATVSERHRAGLTVACASVAGARQHLKGGETGLVLAARDLRQAAESVGMIVGRTYTDDLLDLIFSRFCVGK